MLNVDVATFPQTTFLNVDAIAFRWKDNSEGEIYSSGFFEGILNRTLEINLEENPYPETCVVRSLMMATVMNFKIGPKLAAYISRHSKNASLKELQRIQKAHYGSVKLDGDDLRTYFHAINTQLNRSEKGPVSLPGQQLKFHDEIPPQPSNSKKSIRDWISKITEKVFVHTTPARRLKKRFVKSPPPPAFNVLNINKSHWLTKCPD